MYGTLVINVSGKSSTGKSTITELAGSFYGDPNMSNNGIVRGFNATKNALFAASEGRYGLPILLDDLNANRSEHDRASIVYQFALNEPRGRCDSSGSLHQQRSGWSGIVLITSESPMFDGENVPQGIHARCVDINDIVWTQDSSHSDRIKKGVRENYGHIAPHFANEVQLLGIDTILKLHNIAKDEILCNLHRKDHLSDRIALKLASIKVTAELVKEVYDTTFDVEAVINQLIETFEASIDSRTLDEKALEQFKDFIRINKNHFDIYTLKNTYKHSGDSYGAIIYSNKEKTVNVIKPIFEKFLKENNITERLTILKAWKSNGLIKCDKDNRYDTKVSILGNARAIKLSLTDEEIDYFLPDVSKDIPSSNVRLEQSKLDIFEITYDEPNDAEIWNNGGQNENQD